jgi:excisionase family DNA binding protein
MPRTKKKSEAPPTPSQPAVANGLSGEVFTLAEAAAYLRWNESDVMALVHSQGLPGRCIGGEWRFLKSAIQQWLAAAEPTPESRKAAQMAIAGKWKDDPYLEDMVEEIYRQRGRPITEDGSYRLFHGLDSEKERK